jgi:hypothetical protein
MKELSPFRSPLRKGVVGDRGILHMTNNLRYLDLIFFFGVLAVENTILFIAKSDTAETII